MELAALKKKVLIADDDPDLREAIKDSIELLAPQMRFVEAEDGQVALSKMRNEKFDLLILDLAMPRLDGKGLLQSLTKLPKDFRPSFVLVLSGSITGGQKRLGKVTYQAKPFELENFKTFLSHCFLQGPSEGGSPERGAAPKAASSNPAIELLKLFSIATQSVLKKDCSQANVTAGAVSSVSDAKVSCDSGITVHSSCQAGGVRMQVVHVFSMHSAKSVLQQLTGEEDGTEGGSIHSAVLHFADRSFAEAADELRKIGQEMASGARLCVSSEGTTLIGFAEGSQAVGTEIQGEDGFKVSIFLTLS